jgi:signal transduction histidine kinase
MEIKKNSILIVDDNPKNLQLISSVLSPYYHLLLATSGGQAIRTAQTKLPDLILLDIMMPGENGYDVCKKLKTCEKTEYIPVLFLTAKAEEDDIALAYEIGGVDYITKPFKSKEVLARIKTQLELKNAKDRLQQKNEELNAILTNRDKFFSIIAHDLKSPFTGIVGLTEIMAENVNNFSLSELSDLSKEMYKNAKSMLRLLLDLLDWARLQRGTISYNPIDLDLNEIAVKNIELINKRGEQKGIEIILDVPKEQKVYADEAMINTIFRNLLSNAVKFTERDGKVSVKSKEINDKIVEISVIDNGIGMSDDVIKKLFKIGEKVGQKGTAGEKSTGLGLLLCKEFVEKNGGSILVESKEGIGSTFKFNLQKQPVLAEF